MPNRYSFDTALHGMGGFGKVIHGHDNDLDRDVAVKILNSLKSKFDEGDQERFRREAKILAKLSHPNIPAIYDVNFSSNDDFLIIFQFIAGKTLRQVIQEGGPCQLSEVRVWFHQIASALEHAHEKGIVHRDIKPDNIIITPDRENAYVVDFGIALSSEDTKKLTSFGFAIGTPGYMSPEQQAGEEVDAKTDLYSLGVTLYESLAGKPIPVGQYQDLSAYNEAIPPQIDELIQECLQPAATRLASPRHFISRLAGALKPQRPLSVVLAHGKLHEVGSALEELSAEEFARLPTGQLGLILEKVEDVVSSGDSSLKFASESLLGLLIGRAILINPDDYRMIAKATYQWAFEEQLGGHQGSWRLQAGLKDASELVKKDAHAVLVDEGMEFLNEKTLPDKPDWYLKSVREILTSLLANPNCASGVDRLRSKLREVNQVSRARRA